MTFENPFTPIFGGKPDFFFGRKELLARFDRALIVRGSEDRTLFITGARGNGKTALVEQMSQKAVEAGWNAIDLTADNALQSFFRQIQEFDEHSVKTDSTIEVKVLGSGGSLGGLSTTKTSHYDSDDVDVLFRRACEGMKRGVFVSIDEIQKVPLDDVSKICGAFQMASRKGFDVILVVAGLPYSFEPIIQHDGCTYLRRSVHEELGLFTPAEAKEAFLEAFGLIKGLTIGDDALARLISLSSGHPYMVQLLGYHLLEYLNGSVVEKKHVVTVADVETVAPIAMNAFERRALQPLMNSLSSSAQAYLRAMAKTMGDDHVAETSDIAAYLGKTHQQLGVVRQTLIGEGVVVSPGFGRIRFAIPYLRTYLVEEDERHTPLGLLEEWDV